MPIDLMMQCGGRTAGWGIVGSCRWGLFHYAMRPGLEIGGLDGARWGVT